MAFRDLREFVAFLERKGDLKRIRTGVRCELEIADITDRVVKADGPALLFENVVGYDIPVVTNLLGAERRVCWALDVERIGDLSAKVAKVLGLAQGPMPGSLGDKLKMLGDLAKMAGAAPRSVNKGPCQEVVLTGDGVSLDAYPILKCWPKDAGKFITLPLVITRDPENGKRNVGMYRLQVFDSRTTGMHWHLHKNGREHLRKNRDRRMDVAVAIGADPASIYAATAPLPPGFDELLFAGFLRGDGVEVVKCETVDLEVPARSEIVLEGYVDPAEERLEGPFGDHTGYYSPADSYSVFHVTCITQRSKPWYAATLVGKPPMEDAWLGKATERLFLPMIQMVLPEVIDVNMPPEGVFQNLVIVAIDKHYAGQARKVMYGLWGMMQMALCKIIVVVDGNVNVQNMSEVLWRVSNNVDPRRDLVITDGPLDDLDHSSPTPGFGSKLGIDATAKLAAEGHNRPWPEDAVMSEEIRKLVDEKWSSYGL